MADDLRAVSNDYQAIQNQLTTAVAARQRLDAQLTENEAVAKEFAQLGSDDVVYKLIGPVLVEQDRADAKQNVQTRLEFIRGEIKRVEAQLEDLGSKSDKKRDELVALQARFQQPRQQAVAS